MTDDELLQYILDPSQASLHQTNSIAALMAPPPVSRSTGSSPTSLPTKRSKTSAPSTTTRSEPPFLVMCSKQT